ncbi:MAG TPA: glycosyltransferase family 39 protein, partial [Vicinamibacteria bacterium]|nr:glycosyltransferase family 39 protein [Vicinamibacteria bacterium]
MRATTARRVPILLGAVLLLAIFVTQAWFVLAYPQPPVFGDPAGYLAVGRRLQQAALQLVQGEASAREALGSIRGVLYYAGAGTVFAVLDAWRPGDATFVRLVFAAFNTLAAFGAFLLARRLSGSAVGGLAALALCALHPSFAVELANLFPDPVTGCFFVFSAVFFVEALGRRSAGWMVASGAALGAGLLIRSQLMEYALALIAVCFAVTAPIWVRDAGRRRLAWALAGGLLPFAAGWGAIVYAVGNDLREIEALGNFTFRPRYPYGFWQFLETDGFMGPYRLGTEPYY